jgi:hypothetical protein
MKKHYMKSMLVAGLAFAGTFGVSMAANADTFTILDNSAVIEPVTTHVLSEPVMLDRTLTQPVIIHRQIESPMVIRRTVTSPTVVQRTMTQPVVIDRTLTAPVVIDRDEPDRSLLHFGLFPLIDLRLF